MKNSDNKGNNLNLVEEMEKMMIDMNGLKKLQEIVALQVVECMEKVARVERHLGIPKSKRLSNNSRRL